MLSRALSERSPIHSAVQTLAGSGAEAQALNIERLSADTAESARRDRNVEVIIIFLEACKTPYKAWPKLRLNDLRLGLDGGIYINRMRHQHRPIC